MAKLEKGKTAGAKPAQQLKKRKTAAFKSDAPTKRPKKENADVIKPSAAPTLDKYAFALSPALACPQ